MITIDIIKRLLIALFSSNEQLGIECCTDILGILPAEMPKDGTGDINTTALINLAVSRFMLKTRTVKKGNMPNILLSRPRSQNGNPFKIHCRAWFVWEAMLNLGSPATFDKIIEEAKINMEDCGVVSSNMYQLVQRFFNDSKRKGWLDYENNNGVVSFRVKGIMKKL